MKNKESVLVTGGCGYIGSHLCEQLAKKNYEVIVLDNLSTGFKDGLKAKEKLYVGDINNFELLCQLFTKHKITSVFHLAASIVVPESVENPLGYYQNNTCGTITLLKAMAFCRVKNIVFSSTAAVYGSQQQTVMDEFSVPVPENPYGWSKLMDEQIIKDCHRAYGINHVILRYFNVAGASESGLIGQRFPNATHLIKVACETALGKRSHLEVFGTDYDTEDGTGVRDYIHIDDLAQVHILGLEHLNKTQASHTFNCGYGRGFSVKEVVESVERVHEASISVQFKDRRPGDVAALIANPKKLKDTLNWNPKTPSLDEIVKSAYLWEKKLL